ncbi:putative phosphoethanolamine N-methyltransferase [Pyronema domesticum]|nr:putative phosphoethanolamine N-methyltransferase [Pyronema domesticum]
MLEVDPTLERPDEESYDSAGYDISTASLSSSVNQYVFENGRRYHSYYGTDKYLMPTDEKEQDRLCWDNELHQSPLAELQRILDIGTGTGIWDIDMADKYPMAEVIGTDLSPIQLDWVPANCCFGVDDTMMDWTFQENSFDFIRARNICFGITNWDHVLCTVPGGYVELSEHDCDLYCDDGSMKPDNGAKILIDHLPLERQLKKAGFEDVKAVQVKEPIGPWPKDPTQKQIGAMTLLNDETYGESTAIAPFTRVLGMEVKVA